MKVAIGLIFASGFPVPTPFVLGMADWLVSIISGEGNTLLPADRAVDSARIISSQAFPIDAARNEICRLVLDEDDADYLLFLDADMRHPRDVAHRLIAHNLPIVTGRYQMRKPPFHTVAMRKVGDGAHDYKAIEDQRGLVPIDAAGAGVLLIRRDVLETMRASIGDNWFQYQVSPKGLRDVSEDMWFFEQAKLAGFPAFCDLDLNCTHVASFEVGPTWQTPFLEAYERAKAVTA